MDNLDKGHEPAVEVERVRILERLAAARTPWLSRRALLGGRGGTAALAAFRALQQAEQLLDVGQIGGAVYFAEGSGEGPRTAHIRRLSRAVVLRTFERGRLSPTPVSHLNPKHRHGPKGLPSAVRKDLRAALSELQAEGLAFVFRAVGTDLFVLRADVEAVLGRREGAGGDRPQAAEPQDPVSRPAPPDPSAAFHAGPRPFDPIEAAYRALRKETGLRNVSIARLRERSGIALSQLHDYLLERCVSHRANATLGEPTVASPAEREAALVLDGEPHVYIELC